MLMVPGNPAALSKMADPRRYIDAAFMEQHFQTLYGGALGEVSGRAEHIQRLKPPTRRGYLYQLLAMIGWTSAPALPFMKKRSEEHTSDLQSLMRISYAVFCLKKHNTQTHN